MYRFLAAVALTTIIQSVPSGTAQAGKLLRIAVFETDVTPPIGSALCDGLVMPAKEIVDPLQARGIVLFTEDQPIVLCAMDWVGIGNSGYDEFRKELARAAATSVDRVALHCLHQHDAPGCDFEAEEILARHKLGGKMFDPVFARTAIKHVAGAIKKAVKFPSEVTHIAVGKARVEKVASNRRVLGKDGKVAFVRWSATLDPKVRAEPEGVIDPNVQLISLWNGDKVLASLTWYATHPQSRYGKGGVSADFPGLARRMRDGELPGTLNVHFNGAGGNITAGKYNDGDPGNRVILAERLARGMKEAFASAKKTPIRSADISWRVAAVAMPLHKQYTNVKELQAKVADGKLTDRDRVGAARNQVWAERCFHGHKIELSCLRVGPAYILHMPGELFIEYQLAAQEMMKNSPVMMAAYGDYGPGYVGTAVSYDQGGYETGPASRVAPAVEEVLLTAMADLLK